MKKEELFKNPAYIEYIRDASIGNYPRINKNQMMLFLKSKGSKGLSKLLKEELFKIITDKYWDDYLEYTYPLPVNYAWLRYTYLKKPNLDYYAIKELEYAGLFETPYGLHPEDTESIYYTAESIFEHSPSEWKAIWIEKCKSNTFEIRVSCNELQFENVLTGLSNDFEIKRVSKSYGDRNKKYWYLSCGFKNHTERKEENE